MPGGLLFHWKPLYLKIFDGAACKITSSKILKQYLWNRPNLIDNSQTSLSYILSQPFKYFGNIDDYLVYRGFIRFVSNYHPLRPFH